MDSLTVNAGKKGGRRALPTRGGWRRPLALLFLGVLLAGAAHAGGSGVGPTLRLGDGREDSPSNPMAAFMYFVPLISPEPVTIIVSPGSTQSVRILSISRRGTERKFVLGCDLEFSGEGLEQSVFDLSREIRLHERELRDGGSLNKQLKSIAIEGGGAVQIEVEGAISNNLPAVNEVRLRFDAHGQTSPVVIDLCDVRQIAGQVRQVNEIIARVSTLTFRRQTGRPKMEVTVASVKDKGEGDTLWQNLKGRVKGMAADLLLDPLDIEAAGNGAMLDFGKALVSGSPSFTFPQATNLR
ncbi:MAG: hypothetical protein ABSG59_18225 [Verrucomicrobiota bacterium]